MKSMKGRVEIYFMLNSIDHFRLFFAFYPKIRTFDCFLELEKYKKNYFT
ncbi:MAG: hypothetical protein PWR15_824 [Bacteroidota bacterium]|jgi:peroxiredoxin|nr:hypothetical protein [Bacteroidota bacterium]